MRYAIFEIDPNKSYGITIGSRIKPDSQFREQIRTQIDSAMATFERYPDSNYKLAIVPDWETAESGDTELPEIKAGKQYLMFALLYSDPSNSAESLSNRELEEYREEIGEMLSGIMGTYEGAPRGALIVLRDCTVNLIESETKPWLSWDGESNVIDTSPLYDKGF